VDKAYTVFQHLSLTMIKQHYGSPDPADSKRFIALIQYQNGKVYHLSGFFLYIRTLHFTRKLLAMQAGLNRAFIDPIPL